MNEFIDAIISTAFAATVTVALAYVLAFTP